MECGVDLGAVVVDRSRAADGDAEESSLCEVFSQTTYTYCGIIYEDDRNWNEWAGVAGRIDDWSIWDRTTARTWGREYVPLPQKMKARSRSRNRRSVAGRVWMDRPGRRCANAGRSGTPAHHQTVQW
jgi:hypothetical protein